MVIVYPEKVKKWQEKYEPYLVGCHLKDDAPQEAIDAFQKFKEWVNDRDNDDRV